MITRLQDEMAAGSERERTITQLQDEMATGQSKNQQRVAALETSHRQVLQQLQTQVATLEKASTEQLQKSVKEKEVRIRPSARLILFHALKGVAKGIGCARIGSYAISSNSRTRCG